MSAAPPTAPAGRFPEISLFWLVCGTNGLVFAAGTVLLAISPATVSSDVLLSEAAILAVGFAIILATNGLLLRRCLAPLDRLGRLMGDVDLLRPGSRLPESGAGSVARLIRSFNQMLDRLEAERAAGARAALAAQESERARIARELHDEIGQNLTAVLLGLRRAADRAPEPVAAELEMLGETVRGGLEEVREIARRLRPGVLEDLGLYTALRALATDFAEHTGIAVRRGIGPGLPAVGPEAELVIYRVAQESLTNVARHSNAGTVELTLSRQGRAVLLRVADDGRGLGGTEPGAGMRGMRERALLVDALLEIGPRVGGGTEVGLLVPLPPEAS
ncbi:MAG: HAMP domain-containing sensor histidine kinase [Sporichthyaceae bacterium]